MYNYEDPPWPAQTANLCIKALTLDEENVPVELTSFTAVNEGASVRLDWATASETNNHLFEIQRRTITENHSGEWTMVGYKEGKGTTTDPQSYSYVDDISGINADALEYRLKQIDFNGSFSFSDVVTVDNLAPDGFRLEQNYPNPFNPNTSIQYAVGNPANGTGRQLVTLKVYDILGNEVATLVNEVKETGSYVVEFNAGKLSSGVYYYTITAGDFVQSKKMILMK